MGDQMFALSLLFFTPVMISSLALVFHMQGSKTKRDADAFFDKFKDYEMDWGEGGYRCTVIIDGVVYVGSKYAWFEYERFSPCKGRLSEELDQIWSKEKWKRGV